MAAEAALSRSLGDEPGAGASDSTTSMARRTISERSLGRAASNTSATASSMMFWISVGRGIPSAIIKSTQAISTSEITEVCVVGNLRRHPQRGRRLESRLRTDQGSGHLKGRKKRDFTVENVERPRKTGSQTRDL